MHSYDDYRLFQEQPLKHWLKNCYNVIVRTLLAIFLCAILIGGLSSLSCSKKDSSQSSESSEAGEPSSSVRIEEFKLNQQREDGSKLEVKAEVAKIFVSEDRAELEEADITYHLKEGHIVSAHARKGRVNTKSGHSQAQDNVVIHTDYGFWFLTNFLTYDPELEKIYVEGNYMAFGPELVVTGKDLVVDLKAESFESGGPVLAQIWDLSQLQESVE